MAEPTRRDVLAASGAAAGVLPGASLIAGAPVDRIEEDLARFAGFGSKASGGPGDTASGAWIESELQAAGYTVARQAFDAPFFSAAVAQLSVDGADIALLAQALVVPTPAGGVTGPLVRVDPVSVGAAKLAGAIVLVDLPFQRWSSALAKPIADTLARAWAGGAVAAVIVTNGPTGEAIALNVSAEFGPVAKPVAILAPKLARPVMLAAAEAKSATLRIEGQRGTRPAFNLIGRIDRGQRHWIVVSTPRSGWFGCAGERGSGLAAWLALARWAVAALSGHNLAFVCNSGHEYEYLGSEKALAAKLPPPPGDTSFWMHLGANVATRDWQELPGAQLLPLPSADPQRFLMVSPALVPAARAAFGGQPGLEMPYPTGTGAAGELTGILAAGYGHVAGIFGAHRFHHVVTDDARCVSAPLVARVVDGCKILIRSA
jgi:hypothetical protein